VALRDDARLSCFDGLKALWKKCSMPVVTMVYTRLSR
jgi:hypothetical protein